LKAYFENHPRAFDPESLQSVLRAFDEAWAIVARYDGVNDANREQTRMHLAKHIVELAATHPIDHALRDAAVASFRLKPTEKGGSDT